MRHYEVSVLGTEIIKKNDSHVIISRPIFLRMQFLVDFWDTYE